MLLFQLAVLFRKQNLLFSKLEWYIKMHSLVFDYFILKSHLLRVFRSTINHSWRWQFIFPHSNISNGLVNIFVYIVFLVMTSVLFSWKLTSIQILNIHIFPLKWTICFISPYSRVYVCVCVSSKIVFCLIINVMTIVRWRNFWLIKVSFLNDMAPIAIQFNLCPQVIRYGPLFCIHSKLLSIKSHGIWPIHEIKFKRNERITNEFWIYNQKFKRENITKIIKKNFQRHFGDYSIEKWKR